MLVPPDSMEAESSVSKGGEDLRQIFGTVLQRAWIVAGITLLGVAIAAIYLAHATYKYTASITVAPAQGANIGGLSSQFAGIASAAGVDLPVDQGSAQFQIFQQTIFSREVAERLALQRDVLKGIFDQEWTGHGWQEPPNALAPITHGIKRVLGLPIRHWSRPDAARLADWMQTEVHIEDVPKKPIMILSVQHKDPVFAARFIGLLRLAADDGVRQRALDRSDPLIDYLSAQLRTVQLADHRAALATALSEQMKTRMIARSGVAFAAEPLGRATASLLPTSPKPVLILLLGFLVGGVVGVLAALALGPRRKRIRS